MTHPTSGPEHGPGRRPSSRSRRAESTARLQSSVHELLDQRADLVGVHPMADLVYESLRWSA